MTLSVTTVPTSVNTSPALSPKIIAHGYKATPPALKPEPTVPTSVNTLPAPSPKIIAHGYKATPSALKPATTSLALKHKNSEVLGTRLSKRTLFKDQRSLRTGAASLLGGSLSISSQKFGSGYLAALPNSNRRNHQTPDSIDARSQDTDIASYLDQLQQQVKQQWLPEVSQSSRRTVLNFTVNRSGQLSNLQLAQTSGFSATDQAALKAVKRAAPFAPLPTGYTRNYINIQFTFNINIYGELNLSEDSN